MDPYADIRPNESLCTEFTRYMGSKGLDYYCDLQKKDIGAFSTDMGMHTTPPSLFLTIQVDLYSLC